MSEFSAVQSTNAVTPAYPYPPSWFDRFTDWVDSLHISGKLFYLGLASILVGLQLAIQAVGSDGSVYAFPLAYIATIAYVLGLMHHLDTLAAQALARFRPLMKVDEAEYNVMLYRLTTLPVRPTIIAALLGIVNAISLLTWLPYPIKVHELHFTDTALSINFNHGFSLVIWAIVGVLVYHTLHQLRVVQQIYASCAGIDLYGLRPLYAFSTLSAQTAVGIAFMIYIWYLFAPLLFNIGLAGLIFFTGLSLLTFALPLNGARHLLVEEKERRLSENGERQRVAIAELHRRVDAAEMTDMGGLNQTLAGLEVERAAIDRISTWPWKQETIRAVTAALFFPIIVWLMQWLLRRLLEP